VGEAEGGRIKNSVGKGIFNQSSLKNSVFDGVGVQESYQEVLDEPKVTAEPLFEKE